MCWANTALFSFSLQSLRNSPTPENSKPLRVQQKHLLPTRVSSPSYIHFQVPCSFCCIQHFLPRLSNTCLLFQMACSSLDWAFSQPRTFPQFVSSWKSQRQHRCIRYVQPAAGALRFAVFLPGQGLQSSCKLLQWFPRQGIGKAYN